MRNNGYTNLGLYYSEYKQNKELRAKEQEQEAFNAKIAGSMLPEIIKQDLVTKEFDYGYPAMYNERLVQEQRNVVPVPNRNANYPDMNRVQLQPPVQFKPDTYQQNVITHISNRPDSYILNNQMGVRIAKPANNQVQIKPISQPQIANINNGINYPQKVQTYQNVYGTSPPPKSINNMRSHVYSIPQAANIKINLQNQPQFAVAQLAARNDIVESNQAKRKHNVAENGQNYRNQNQHFNEHRRKQLERDPSSDKSEEYFKV